MKCCGKNMTIEDREEIHPVKGWIMRFKVWFCAVCYHEVKV